MQSGCNVMDNATNITVKGEKKILDIKLGGLMKKAQRNYASDFSQSPFFFSPLTMNLLTVEKIVCKAFQITLLDILMLHSPFSTMDCRRGHQGEISELTPTKAMSKASSYT